MFRMTLGRTHDKIKICEGGESLILRVDDDPMRLAAGIIKAQKRLEALGDKPTVGDEIAAVRNFAEVIWGKEQTEKLFAFYRDDTRCVINIASRYFVNRLAAKITRDQKKIKK